MANLKLIPKFQFPGNNQFQNDQFAFTFCFVNFSIHKIYFEKIHVESWTSTKSIENARSLQLVNGCSCSLAKEKKKSWT
jgi:hypothetical protein